MEKNNLEKAKKKKQKNMIMIFEKKKKEKKLFSVTCRSIINLE